MIKNTSDENKDKELNNNSDTLSGIIKSEIIKQSLSLRKLSRITGISAASISRIINNKQPATVQNLIKFSKHLDIPIEQLLPAASVGNNKDDEDVNYFLINIIQDILQYFDITLNNVIKNINSELKKYEQYAKTEEGKKIIHKESLEKINRLNGIGLVIDQLKKLYQLFCEDTIMENDKVLIGSALLYFILSTDVIPDYIFPIGFLDDAIAINLVIKKLPHYF